MIKIAQDAEGTLVLGTRRGDGSAEILKPQGFRWSSRIGAWYFPRNRRIPLPSQLQGWADKLTAAGLPAEVEIESHTATERELAREVRLEDRQEVLDAKAERREAESDVLLERAHQIGSMIPFGQPILVGHHSERRHRKDLERIDNNMRKGFDKHAEAREAARKAIASQANQQARLTAPVTLRRIERLEVELRDIERKLTGTHRTQAMAVIYGTDKPAEGAWAVRLTERKDQIEGELEHWRAHIEQLKSEGVRVWTKADFAKGDLVLSRGTWYEVKRVNPKSVTVPHPFIAGHTWTVTYDDIRDMRKPEAASA